MRVLKKGHSNMKSLAYISLVHPVLEYEALCWDPQRKGQIHLLDCVQKKVAKFENHTSESVWETLAQHSKLACIFTLFKAYTGERAWQFIGDRLKGSC
jgi:hypothetical protein